MSFGPACGELNSSEWFSWKLLHSSFIQLYLYLHFETSYLRHIRILKNIDSGRWWLDKDITDIVRHLADGRKSTAEKHLLLVLLKPLSQIVGEVVLDISAELIPELGVKFQNLKQLRNMDALQEAVCQGSNICTGFDNLGRIGDCVGGISVDVGACQRNITANQVTLPWDTELWPLMGSLMWHYIQSRESHNS